MNVWGAAVYAIVVLTCYLYAFKKDRLKGVEGLKKGARQLLKQLPFIASIFLLVGIFDVFVPRSVVVSFVGHGKGLLALLNAAVVGSVVGGPVASVYPLGALLIKKGAPVAVAAVFINAWVMVGFISMPFEISIFGKRFVFVRNLLAFLGAIIIGVLTGLILTGAMF